MKTKLGVERKEAPFVELGEGFVKLLRSKFNTSQYDAIVAAATTSGFTLIKVRLPFQSLRGSREVLSSFV
jgi:hypothetical protein